MRINSSGDWIVSNTVANVASNYSTQGGCGWVESDNHFEIATTSDRSALEVGKNNANDGALVTFRKQSTPVGNIGAYLGDSYIGTGVAGLRFYDAGPAVSPHNTTTNAGSNGTTDLGTPAGRFRDIYLSSSVLINGAVPRVTLS